MSYRKNRDKEIYNLKKSGRTISQISDDLWGEGYHPFFTGHAMRKYIIQACKRGKRVDKLQVIAA